MPVSQILLLEVCQYGQYTLKQTLETYTVEGLLACDDKVSELKEQYAGRTDREIKVASSQGSALYVTVNGKWELSKGFYF